MIAPVRSPRGLALALIVLLWAQVAVLGLRALALLNRIRVAGMIDRHEWVSQATANQADAWVRSASGVWVLLFAATIVVWCLWQHRSHQAARALVPGMDLSAAWAVGCWFVPIVNLFKPFQAMRELWRASEGGPAWRGQATWPVLGWWWATWLGFNLLGSIPGATDGADLDAIRRGDLIGLVSVTLGVSAALLAVQVVRRIGVRLTAATSVAALPSSTWGAPVRLPGPPVPPPPPATPAG